MSPDLQQQVNNLNDLATDIESQPLESIYTKVKSIEDKSTKKIDYLPEIIYPKSVANLPKKRSTVKLAQEKRKEKEAELFMINYMRAISRSSITNNIRKKEHNEKLLALRFFYEVFYAVAQDLITYKKGRDRDSFRRTLFEIKNLHEHVNPSNVLSSLKQLESLLEAEHSQLWTKYGEKLPLKERDELPKRHELLRRYGNAFATVHRGIESFKQRFPKIAVSQNSKVILSSAEREFNKIMYHIRNRLDSYKGNNLKRFESIYRIKEDILLLQASFEPEKEIKLLEELRKVIEREMYATYDDHNKKFYAIGISRLDRILRQECRIYLNSVIAEKKIKKAEKEKLEKPIQHIKTESMRVGKTDERSHQVSESTQTKTQNIEKKTLESKKLEDEKTVKAVENKKVVEKVSKKSIVKPSIKKDIGSKIKLAGLLTSSKSTLAKGNSKNEGVVQKKTALTKNRSSFSNKSNRPKPNLNSKNSSARFKEVELSELLSGKQKRCAVT